jgi:hypothetical protein
MAANDLIRVTSRGATVGESMPTPGLGVLDQVRESSMADEGGTSGAVMESQDGDTLRSPTSHRPIPELSALRTPRHRGRVLAVVVPAVLVALLVGTLFAARRAR